MKKFRAQNIDFSYSITPLLTQASLEVAQGDIVGILGPNGSGKTTFFDIICDLKKAKCGFIKMTLAIFYTFLKSLPLLHRCACVTFLKWWLRYHQANQ